MIVWSGRGILSFLALVFAIFISQKIIPVGYNDVSLIVSLLLAALFSVIMGKKWNSEIKTVIDKDSGKEIQLQTKHSLFWIKMEYWGFIYGVFAVILLVIKLKALIG